MGEPAGVQMPQLLFQARNVMAELGLQKEAVIPDDGDLRTPEACGSSRGNNAQEDLVASEHREFLTPFPVRIILLHDHREAQGGLRRKLSLQRLN
jgi:hypothetical protein